MKHKLSFIIFIAIVIALSVMSAAFAIQNNTQNIDEVKTPRAHEKVVMPEIPVEECESEIEESEMEEYSEFYDERIPLDRVTQSELYYAANAAGIDPYLAVAVIWQESRFQNVSGDGGASLGYMQIMPKWHKERMKRLNCSDLMVPSENFLVGCDFLGELLREHSLESSLTYYNSGHFGCNNYAKSVVCKYNVLLSGGEVE